MKTILITGCSSGFGLEIARHFLARGWNVIATMRSPKADLLPASPHLRILPLEVTSAESIRALTAAAGPVDVLVNNAGVGLLSALEGVSMERVREVFEINTFGTMAVMQAFLPQFRERRGGTIINVTSSVTVKSLPLLSIYTASKAAVNAFTESVALELAAFNIRACLVLPGRAPTTAFGTKARARGLAVPEPYGPLLQQVMSRWTTSTEPVTTAADVAEVVWRVAIDPAAPQRLPAGPDAVLWAEAARQAAAGGG